MFYADHIDVAGQRVNKGETKIIQLSTPHTEVLWLCGLSEASTTWSTPANQLKVTFQSDGTIHWEIYTCAACHSVDSTSGKCNSTDSITVAGQQVNKGERKTIQLSTAQTGLKWFCGSSEERTAWGTLANQLKVSFQIDGTIEWDIFECVQSGANSRSVHIGLSAQITFCLVLAVFY